MSGVKLVQMLAPMLSSGHAISSRGNNDSSDVIISTE